MFLAVLAVTMAFSAFAQMENPVSWSAEANKVSENVYEIVLTGEIEGDWHIYDLGPYENGPIPTSLVVKGNGVKVVGKPYLKTEAHKAYDEMFAMEIGTCESGVQIAQKVEVTLPKASVANVTVE